MAGRGHDLDVSWGKGHARTPKRRLCCSSPKGDASKGSSCSIAQALRKTCLPICSLWWQPKGEVEATQRGDVYFIWHMFFVFLARLGMIIDDTWAWIRRRPLGFESLFAFARLPFWVPGFLPHTHLSHSPFWESRAVVEARYDAPVGSEDRWVLSIAVSHPEYDEHLGKGLM